MEMDWVEIVVQQSHFRVGSAGEICVFGKKQWIFLELCMIWISLWGLSTFLVCVAEVIEPLEVKIVFLSLSSWNVTITFSSVLFDMCVINVF